MTTCDVSRGVVELHSTAGGITDRLWIFTTAITAVQDRIERDNPDQPFEIRPGAIVIAGTGHGVNESPEEVLAAIDRAGFVNSEFESMEPDTIVIEMDGARVAEAVAKRMP